ncbi:MAG TPA: hypothetical protein VMB19_05340 [Silvibacterium sp.]|nr:hypothetical protein [Silvibacterium sp.]
METATIDRTPFIASWPAIWRRFASYPGPRRCVHAEGLWRRIRGVPPGIMIQGSWYCLERCLETVLARLLQDLPFASARPSQPRRVPLGLLLLARQELTADQLRAGLGAQREAGSGRIGEWLQELGFVSEQQVTAALARQWSCPVLRGESWPSSQGLMPQIPVTLLESFEMAPVAYVEATRTLHIAFGEGIDYSVLFALERMLDCRTEPCLAPPRVLRHRLEMLAGPRQESEARIEGVGGMGEFARIVRSYCLRLHASEIRIAQCHERVWIRLFRRSSGPLDLLLRLAETDTSASSSWLPERHPLGLKSRTGLPITAMPDRGA